MAMVPAYVLENPTLSCSISLAFMMIDPSMLTAKKRVKNMIIMITPSFLIYFNLNTEAVVSEVDSLRTSRYRVYRKRIIENKKDIKDIIHPAKKELET